MNPAYRPSFAWKRLLLAFAVTVFAYSNGFSENPLSFSHYQIGDVAQETVIATESFIVADPQEHPEIFEEVRTAIPPVYGYSTNIAFEVRQQVIQTWDSTQKEFIVALERVFNTKVLKRSDTNSIMFKEFVVAFRAINKGFPVSDDHARRWAQGDESLDILKPFAQELEEFSTDYFIRPNDEPRTSSPDLDSVHLVSVQSFDDLDSETLSATQSLVSRKQFLPLTEARKLFHEKHRRSSKAENKFISSAIRPNTQFLESISMERWEKAQGNLTGKITYNEGDPIIHEGELITAVAKEALDYMAIANRYNAMKQSLSHAGNSNSLPIDDHGIHNTTPSDHSTITNTVSHDEGHEIVNHDHSKTTHHTALPPIRNDLNYTDFFETETVSFMFNAANPWHLMIGSSVLSVLLAIYLINRRKKRKLAGMTPEELAEAPHANKSIMESLVQTLFRQRQQLIKSKTKAIHQVTAMEDRLSKLQPEILDKLHAYEENIKELEAKLANNQSDNEVTATKDAAIEEPVMQSASDTVSAGSETPSLPELKVIENKEEAPEIEEIKKEKPLPLEKLEYQAPASPDMSADEVVEDLAPAPVTVPPFENELIEESISEIIEEEVIPEELPVEDLVPEESLASQETPPHPLENLEYQAPTKPEKSGDEALNEVVEDLTPAPVTVPPFKDELVEETISEIIEEEVIAAELPAEDLAVEETLPEEETPLDAVSEAKTKEPPEEAVLSENLESIIEEETIGELQATEPKSAKKAVS